MILYKYRTDSERTEQIITKRQLWFAAPDSLNDPLECSIQEIAKASTWYDLSNFGDFGLHG